MFGAISPTRSPGLTPRARSRPATSAVARSSAVYESATSSSRIAVRSPWRAAEAVIRSDRFILHPLLESGHAGDVTPDDQRLHRLGPFEGVDDLDVTHVADHVVLQQDPVAAEQVTRLGDHPARLARVVELRQAGDRVRQPAGLLEARDLHAVELHAGHLGEHLHEPVLDDLEADERLAELLAPLAVGKRDVVGRDGVAERGPRARAAR